jgi:hypothetical protein
LCSHKIMTRSLYFCIALPFPEKGHIHARMMCP